MANPEQLKILKSGVAAWNEWRLKNPTEKIDLTQANLEYTNLKDTNLQEANLLEPNSKVPNLMVQICSM